MWPSWPFAGVETSYDINRQADLGVNELKCVKGMNIEFIAGPYPEVARVPASCQQDYCFTQIGRRWFLQKKPSSRAWEGPLGQFERSERRLIVLLMRTEDK